MANRRMGGMGGPPQRGNRSFSQHQPFQGNVNPWQGNMPSNNLNPSGLLGQLAANPQQLAIALTNLLQPQQQMNNPPSLLSLNTSPAFSQDNRDSFNRFGNRGRFDSKRHEPYNKNRNGGWRPMDNKNPGNNRNRNFQVRNDNRSNNDNRRREPPKVKPVVKDDKRKLEKKDDSETGNNSIDLILDDTREDEAGEETKRDWKQEKTSGGGDEQKEGEEADDVKKEDANAADSKYSGIPQKFLHCFVCNKDMWDGESFQKHVRGRAHKQMMQSLEESFHITVNIMRENMRLSEEKKVIELNRMHRLNKNKFSRKFQEPESHCNMCDLKFLGKIITHRKTEGHQRLKRFLHPNCEICSKEFPSRMDWVDHRLTPEHLKQLSDTLRDKLGDEDGEIIEEELEADLEPLLEESMEMEDEHPILELSDDLANLQNRIPAYKRSRCLGTENLKPFTGFMCDICHRSFSTEELAQGHLRTEGHYYAFVEAAKAKFQKQTEEAAAKEAENKKRKREEEESAADETKEEVAADSSQNGNEDMYDPEEACNEEEETETSAETSTPVKAAEPEPAAAVEEPAKEEPKEEPPQTNVATPRVTRRVGGAVKNGAGPKSKKARKP